jgi:anti-anti-sigma factor
VDSFAVSRQELPAGVVRLELVGEVDVASAAELTTAQLREVGTQGVRALVVDLQRVTFLDSTGIAALVAGMQEAGKRGIAYTATNPRGMVRTVLEVTGVLGPLTDAQRASPANEPAGQSPGTAGS